MESGKRKTTRRALLITLSAGFLLANCPKTFAQREDHQDRKAPAKTADEGAGFFAKMLEKRGVRLSSNDVSIAPTTDQGWFRILPSINGEKLVLSIPVEI